VQRRDYKGENKETRRKAGSKLRKAREIQCPCHRDCDIFALVYIDDIVIFSITFEDHLKHLDQVFAAIAESGITLSPKKCNLGYQSLLLLGQKVSGLGLSTHKE
jgi:hypothetical protein